MIMKKRHFTVRMVTSGKDSREQRVQVSVSGSVLLKTKNVAVATLTVLPTQTDVFTVLVQITV